MIGLEDLPIIQYCMLHGVQESRERERVATDGRRLGSLEAAHPGSAATST